MCVFNFNSIKALVFFSCCIDCRQKTLCLLVCKLCRCLCLRCEKEISETDCKIELSNWKKKLYHISHSISALKFFLSKLSSNVRQKDISMVKTQLISLTWRRYPQSKPSNSSKNVQCSMNVNQLKPSNDLLVISVTHFLRCRQLTLATRFSFNCPLSDKCVLNIIVEELSYRLHSVGNLKRKFSSSCVETYLCYMSFERITAHFHLAARLNGRCFPLRSFH